MLRQISGKVISFLFICLSSLMLFVTGCSNSQTVLPANTDIQDDRTGLVPIDLKALKDMIQNERSFVLQVSRDECIYCEYVEKIEADLFRLDEALVIFELDLACNNHVYEQAKQYLQELFPEFYSLPGIFVIENGKESKRLEYSDNPAILKQRLTSLLSFNY